MTRPIMFRGKCIDNVQWVYGYLVVDPSGKHRIYLQPFPEATSNTYYFVNPDTVGQYTGVDDNNGAKVFEGDIIGRCFVDYNKNCVVVFKGGCFCLSPIGESVLRTMNTVDHPSGSNWMPVNGHNTNYNFIIIGTIHDTPLVNG